MSCYWPPAPHADHLVAAVLRQIHADHYADESSPHWDAERECSAEQVALAARELTRAAHAMPEAERPIGIAVVNLFALRSTDPASSATTPTPLAPTTTPSCGTPRPLARSQRAARLAPPSVRETVMARLELELIPTRPAPYEPWKEPMTPARQAQNWAVLKAALFKAAA